MKSGRKDRDRSVSLLRRDRYESFGTTIQLSVLRKIFARRSTWRRTVGILFHTGPQWTQDVERERRLTCVSRQSCHRESEIYCLWQSFQSPHVSLWLLDGTTSHTAFPTCISRELWQRFRLDDLREVRRSFKMFHETSQTQSNTDITRKSDDTSFLNVNDVFYISSRGWRSDSCYGWPPQRDSLRSSSTNGRPFSSIRLSLLNYKGWRRQKRNSDYNNLRQRCFSQEKNMTRSLKTQTIRSVITSLSFLSSMFFDSSKNPTIR